MDFRLPRLLLPIALCAFGCSSTVDLPDASVMIDAGVAVDSGVRATCPLPENNPACNVAEDCGDELAPPGNCEWCRTRNNSVCAVGQCSSPELIDGDEYMILTFRAPDLETLLKSYAGYAVVQETSGGQQLTCAQVLADQVDWSESCLNVIDARYAENSGTTGDTFQLRFSRIAGGLDVLLVAYAFDAEFAAGTPIGVACAEARVPEKGTSGAPTDVSGGEMVDLR